MVQNFKCFSLFWGKTQQGVWLQAAYTLSILQRLMCQKLGPWLVMLLGGDWITRELIHPWISPPVSSQMKGLLGWRPWAIQKLSPGSQWHSLGLAGLVSDRKDKEVLAPVWFLASSNLIKGLSQLEMGTPEQTRNPVLWKRWPKSMPAKNSGLPGSTISVTWSPCQALKAGSVHAG